MSTHDIPDDTLNSRLEYCIDEYVRKRTHRDILRDKWFGDYSLEEIAERHKMSVTNVKNVLYTTGDKIILRAYKMSVDLQK